MLDFILRKLLPFALARSMSIAAIPLFQFLLVAFCSREEAGRFYLLISLALIASQVADLGISRAMPVLYAESDEKIHICLPEINLLRWFAGLVLGLIFLVVNRFGEVTWSWDSGGLSLFMLCFGRVILLGHQGYSHARQQYTRLLRGAIVHFAIIILLYLVYTFHGSFNANAAIISLTAGVWGELFMLDRPAARAVRKPQYCWSEALNFVAPFARVGVYTAVYNRIESVVAGIMFEKDALGVFGTLDSAFRISIWPSYVSSQAMFPNIRDAVGNRDRAAMLRHSRRYFAFSAMTCILFACLGVYALIYYGSADYLLTLSVMLLLPAMLLAVPYAFMVPLYYSLKLEKLYSKITLGILLLRCSLAPLLALAWGYAGLCAIHLIVGLAAILALWLGCRRQLLAAFPVGNGDDNNTERE